MEYSRQKSLPQEEPHEISDKKPAQDWPSRGSIEFKEVVMRYRPGLPLVLKGLSMSIDGGEKIGVVGRYVKVYFISVNLRSSRDPQNGRRQIYVDAGIIPDCRTRLRLYHRRRVSLKTGGMRSIAPHSCPLASTYRRSV